MRCANLDKTTSPLDGDKMQLESRLCTLTTTAETSVRAHCLAMMPTVVAQRFGLRAGQRLLGCLAELNGVPVQTYYKRFGANKL